MLALLDFIPLVLFFISYKIKGKFFAIGVLLVATCLQMLVSYLLQGRKLEAIQKFTLIAVVCFGSVSLYFRNEKILQWWPTFLEIGIALALLAGMHIWQKNPLKMMLGSRIELPDPIWQRLAMMWIAFCLLMAALNAYIVIYQSYDQWMDFKLWSRLLWLGFAIVQAVLIAKHMPQTEENP